jgi:hypothetical protein
MFPKLHIMDRVWHNQIKLDTKYLPILVDESVIQILFIYFPYFSWNFWSFLGENNWGNFGIKKKIFYKFD